MSEDPSQVVAQTLLKENLAARLKEAIMDGRLQPGQRVVEGFWAREFGAAQASVREAINLLISDGFLVKDSGRSARVVDYSEAAVAHVYEVRGALEALAAQRAAATGADLSAVAQALNDMEQAAGSGDMRALIENDFRFHTALAEASGNPVLVEMTTRLLAPLFAFTLLRVIKSGQGPGPWVKDLGKHHRMLELIREGNPPLAARYVEHAVNRFAAAAYRVWSNEPATSRPDKGAE
jgi:DNA-binding GntR family transcriptional regulator